MHLPSSFFQGPLQDPILQNVGDAVLGRWAGEAWRMQRIQPQPPFGWRKGGCVAMRKPTVTQGKPERKIHHYSMWEELRKPEHGNHRVLNTGHRIHRLQGNTETWAFSQRL